MASRMALTSLLVCADEASAGVLRGILEELGIGVEACPDTAQALPRLVQERFDAVIVDCVSYDQASELIRSTRRSQLNGGTLVVAIVNGQENVRRIFSLGVNFVLYKPVSPERALSSLRAARGLMRRERRRNARVSVHSATRIDYANVEKQQATLVDVSEDGIAIQCEKKLPPSCKVYFQFNLPGNTTTVRLSGQVVWQDSAGRVGIRFADVPQSSRRVLRDWLRVSLAHSTSTEHPEPKAVRPTPAAASVPSRPADALARFRAEPGNRRGKDRYACRLGAEVYRLGESVPNRCNLTDLSSGGCYLEMPTPFANGSAVEIGVRTSDMKLRMRGKVHSVHPGFGMGVAFELKEADEREQVEQLMDFVAATARAAGPVGESW